MHISCIRLLAALALLPLGGLSAQAAIPGFPGTPICPPNSSCAPGTPTPPGTCGPGNAGATCTNRGPAIIGGSSSINLGAGNPINVINGNKYGREVDMAPLPGTLGLEIIRHYNSSLSGSGASTNLVGRGWKLSYETDLYVSGRTVQIVQADGSRIIFNRDPRDPSLCASADPANGTVSIVKTNRGDEYTWRWTNGRQLSFDSKGKLVQILAPGGLFVSLRYDPAGLLTRVTDPQGRRLDLSYPSREQARAGDAFRGVQSIASPVGRFTYHYGSAMAAGADIDKRLLLANLVKVSMPVGARTYHYEQADRPTLLTGISELVNGKAGKAAWQRIATYGYDINGKANLSVRGWPARLARGADGKPLQPARLADGTGIGQVTLEYGKGETVVANSQGRQTVFRHAILAGEYRLLEVRGAGCSGCGETNVRYAYDELARLQTTTRLSATGEPLSSERQEYDRRGRLASVSDIAYTRGKALPARLKLRYEYEADAAYPARILRPSVVPGRFYVTSFEYAQGPALAGLPVQVSEQGYMPTLEGTGSAGTIMRTIRYRYDHYGQRVAADGPLPNAASKPGPANSDITLTRYDGRTKLPIRTDMPGGGVTEVLERDAALRPTVTRFTDADGTQVVRVRYNWRGQPEEMRVEGTAADGSPPLSQTVHYAYDTNGKLTSTTHPGDMVQRFDYDAAGRMTRKWLPDGASMAAVYDTEGRRTSAVMLDASGRSVSMAHYRLDEAGRVAGMDDSLGTTADASFTPAGAVAEISNPLGIATRFDYDDNGMLVSRTSAPGTPDAASISFAYDPHGRQIKVIDANGVTTLRRFDDFGRPMLEVNPDRGVTLYFHDPAGRLLVRSDGQGNDTRYRHDLRGRLVAVGTTAIPELTRYRYVGKRLTEIVATPDGNADHAIERTGYRYDALGQVLEEKRWFARAGVKNDATGLSFVTTNTYDEAGRLHTQVLPDGHRLQYRYASRGGLNAILFDEDTIVADIKQGPAGLSGLTFGNGVRHRIERDARGQLTSIKATGMPVAGQGWLGRLGDWLGHATAPTEHLVYAQANRFDQAGRLISIRRNLGRAGNLSSRQVDEQYAYDVHDRLIGAGTDGQVVRYGYDKGGNRRIEARPDRLLQATAANTQAVPGAREYLYADGTNRLVARARLPWGGGKLNGTPSGVRGQQGLFDNAWLYGDSGAPFARLGFSTLDAVRTNTTQIAASHRFEYDMANRLVAVYDSRENVIARYAYNAHGERFAKTLYAVRSSAGPVVRTSLPTETTPATTYSLYRNQRLSAEADSEGHITAHYIYVDGKPVAKIDMEPNPSLFHAVWRSVRGLMKAAGEHPPADASLARIYAIHTDHLGTPQAVTDTRQEIVWQARTSPFGQATVMHASMSGVSGKPFMMNLRLPGQVFDAETGLHQNYLRDYDPELGRYTTPDPSGLAGGINPYAYVDSNPLTHTDTLGLYQSDIHYYMNMFLALAAGMSLDDAQTLALAAQFVDDNDDTRPLHLDDSEDHRRRLLTYHFTAVPTTIDPGTGWVRAGVRDYGTPVDNTAFANIPENAQLRRLRQAIATSRREANLRNPRCTQLQLMGEYLHSFEDTFAHRDSNNHPFQLSVGLGHGGYGSDPDYTYDHLSPILGNGSFNWNHNEERTLQMEREVYAKLRALGDPSKAKRFADFEMILAEFNDIPEHEGEGFIPAAPSTSRKLLLLQQTLAVWGIQVNWAGPGATTQYTYNEVLGERNRNTHLCDANGNALDQKKYQGTILPSCNR